jgi:hypothetical protein
MTGTGAFRNAGSVTEEREEAGPVRSQTYEITFAGRAGSVLCSAFDDCKISIGPYSTTLRAEVSDPAALYGLIERVAGFRLQVTDVRLVTSH